MFNDKSKMDFLKRPLWYRRVIFDDIYQINVQFRSFEEKKGGGDFSCSGVPVIRSE
jgi:hypothetical protein